MIRIETKQDDTYGTEKYFAVIYIDKTKLFQTALFETKLEAVKAAAEGLTEADLEKN